MPIIYVTQYAITYGIETLNVEEEVIQKQSLNGTLLVYNQYDPDCEDGFARELSVDDWHLTKEDAIANAEIRRLQRIKECEEYIETLKKATIHFATTNQTEIYRYIKYD